MVGEPVQQSAGEALQAEDLGPPIEGQIGGDHDGALLVALAEDLKKQLGTGAGQWDEAQLVDDQEVQAGKLSLQNQEAAHVLDRALACDLFATSIANNAFGVLLLNPPYDWDQEDKRVEHAFLTHCTRYLTDGGLLLFIVPKQRLSVSARYLSSHYRDLRCWAFPSPEREVFDQVVLVGRRKAEPSPDPYAEEQVRDWAEGEPEEFSLRPYPVYDPPVVAAGDILFATRTVDPLAAVAEARKTGLWASQEVRDSLWPAQDQRTRPLMPLRRGHMAMLVAAGFLDNLVLEAEGRRILVKGRTTKELVLAEETENTEVYRERLRTTVVALDLDGGEITDIAA